MAIDANRCGVTRGYPIVMLVAARLRHVAGVKWGMRRYLNMDRLREQQKEAPAMAG